MATYDNDAPQAGAMPAYGVMMIDGNPATEVRFERVQREGQQFVNLTFQLGGRDVGPQLAGMEPDALEGIVGKRNAAAILDHAEGRGSLVGDGLSFAQGLSPGERAAREQAAEREALTSTFAAGMRERHPAFAGVDLEGQWTVQQRGEDGLYRDVTRTDDAQEAHRLFLQGSQFRVIDNRLNDYAADYVERQTASGKEMVADYHGRSTFQEAIRETEPNMIRNASRERSADIDVDEALAAAKSQRDRDALSRQMDDQRQQVAFLDQDAKRRDRANDLDELAGRNPDFGPLTMTEHEKNRRVELTQQLHAQFRVHGSEFRFKDQPGKIAFRDAGTVIKSSSNDERVAQAMVTMAEAKGWKTISVSGHPDFMREAWLAASLRGLEVKGYKPQEQDRADLAALQDRQQRNTIEQGPERVRRDRNEPAPEKGAERPREAAAGQPTPQAEQSAPRASERGPRVHEGILLSHGAAHYRNDPKEAMSYFVTLATGQGEQTVWGKDLQRSMQLANPQAGEAIRLSFAGNKEVTVEANKRDKDGNVVGRETIEARRNAWEVNRPEQSERAEIFKAVAAAVVADKVRDPEARQLVLQAINDRVDRSDRAGTLPPVKVYDNTAPAQDRGQERARPQVERHAERTR